MIRATATLRTAGLDAYIRRLPDELDGGAEEVADETAATWRSLVHVVTGSYRASIGIQTHTKSEFPARAAAALALNPKAQIIPEPPRPARKGAASVFSAVQHAIFEELGSIHRPAHPAFIYAVDAARAQLKAEMRQRIQP